jgi:hypothetical protein
MRVAVLNHLGIATGPAWPFAEEITSGAVRRQLPEYESEMAQNKAYTALLGVSTKEFFDFQSDPSLLAGIPALSRIAA